MPRRGTQFPPEKVLRRVREKLSDVNYRGGNRALPESASQVQRAKYEVCQLIARYRREHGLMQKEIAERIGIDESRASDILRGKIDGFTLDRLIGYAEKLHPDIRIQIHAA